MHSELLSRDRKGVPTALPAAYRHESHLPVSEPRPRGSGVLPRRTRDFLRSGVEANRLVTFAEWGRWTPRDDRGSARTQIDTS